LVDVLPDILKAFAGVPLKFQLQVVLGEGNSPGPEMVQALNASLGEISPVVRAGGEQIAQP
jgi:hypothetical protein